MPESKVPESRSVYAADKALAHPHRLAMLRDHGQPYPAHLHLILSDLCNLDCPECAYRLSGYPSNALFNVIRPDGSADHNPNRMLSTALVKGVLLDCAVMDTRAIEFTGGGEPTLHPDCAELIDFAQRLHLETALITNGLLLHKRPGLLDVAVQSKWLRISVDAATARTYGIVRPGLGGPQVPNFFTAMEAIRRAQLRRDELKTDCALGVGFVVQKDNWHELYDACKLARDLGADNIRISGAFTPERDSYHADHRREAEELERRAVADFHRPAAGFSVYGRFHEKVADLAGPPTEPFCGYQNFTTYLGGDGNLYRCCVTSYNPQGLIGNVEAAGGFKRLWDSLRKRELFSGFDARTCPPCQFRDRNAAIRAAVESASPPAVIDVAHKHFV